MTLNGARNETAAQMQEVLRLQGLDSQDVNEGLFAISSLLQHADKKVEVRLSNALWANKDVTIDEQFIRDNKEYFGAMLANMDFSARTRSRRSTAGSARARTARSPYSKAPIDPQTILFIMNAIYFEGPGKSRSRRRTRSRRRFTGSAGTKRWQ